MEKLEKLSIKVDLQLPDIFGEYPCLHTETANWNATNFNEHFLFERLGFGKQPEKEKRRALKGAFQDLQEIGYIKSFAYDPQKKEMDCGKV